MFTTIIASLYLAAGIISVIAGIFQLMRLMRLGTSEEMSIPTWGLWFATQAITLLYFVTLGQIFLIIVSSLWTLQYGVMLGLILYYRRFPRQRSQVLAGDTLLTK